MISGSLIMITELAVLPVISERHPILQKTLITEDPYWKNGTLISHPEICGLFRETAIPDKNSCIQFWTVPYSSHSGFEKGWVVQIWLPFL